MTVYESRGRPSMTDEALCKRLREPLFGMLADIMEVNADRQQAAKRIAELIEALKQREDQLRIALDDARGDA